MKNKQNTGNWWCTLEQWRAEQVFWMNL